MRAMILGSIAVALLFLVDICSAAALVIEVHPSTTALTTLSNPTLNPTEEIFEPISQSGLAGDIIQTITQRAQATKSSLYVPVAIETSDPVGIATVSGLYTVATETSDPVGIAAVSGLYGPGAWSGWVLTVVNAWCRILLPASEEKLSMNTWAFLVGMNWAAANLLRRNRLIKQASTNSDKLIQLGSYAAAFSVTFWGLFNAVMQLVFTLLLARNPERVKRRVWALLAGIVLPLIALSVSSFQLLPELIDSLPAIYWHEMDHQVHKDLFEFTANSSVFLLPSFLIFAYHKGDKYLSCPLIATIRPVVSKTWNSLLSSYLFWISLIVLVVSSRFYIPSILAFIIYFFIWIIIYAFASNALWFVAVGLPLIFFQVWVFAIANPILWLIWILKFSVEYILEGYVRHNVRVSKSCFFMPCAPQPITDEDQLYPLVVGLASLLIFDVGPAVYKKYMSRGRLTVGNHGNGSSNNHSIRAQLISAPLMPENSLGWN